VRLNQKKQWRLTKRDKQEGLKVDGALDRNDRKKEDDLGKGPGAKRVDEPPRGTL